jgi:uncharacterized protein (DUF362 family)
MDHVVAAVRTAAKYGTLDSPQPAPELPGGFATTVSTAALRQILRLLQFDAANYGTIRWNPLGALVRPGARIVLKPNFVIHSNQGGYGLECLLTHPSVIEAALEYVALTKPASVVLGDAPVQGCDFAQLREALQLDSLVEKFRQRGIPIELIDFRRTVLSGGTPGGERVEGVRSEDRFVLFDLGGESLLEPIAVDSDKFRVTMYNPELLQQNHQLGRHRYLIAREIIEADLVINLPKLKSHKKACVTGALKNLVGINGNKEFLPHHRKGGSESGGDCYEGGSSLKLAAEHLFDFANRRSSGRLPAAAVRAGQILGRCSTAFGSDENLEGSWYGNDTIWRTCLDLQRILRYGEVGGGMAESPQRVVLSLTDAIVGGQGEGPLANDPVASGFMTGSLNPAAAEWINTRLMGFDPQRIPLTREAFDRFRHPLVSYAPDAIRVRLNNDEEIGLTDVVPFGAAFEPASGWRGHCELKEIHDSALAKPTLVA